jgi:NADPH-dependent glutamate synthase beta subunit-like oxidoreductase
METYNFPDVCGRICPQERQCEGSCVMANRNPVVCIGKLEAFVIDYVRRITDIQSAKKLPDRHESGTGGSRSRRAGRGGRAHGSRTRRSEVEMPGRYEERVNAVEEGVQFEWLTAPVKFIGNAEGKVKAAECIRMKLGLPDAKGRPPVAIEGSNFLVNCDTVALAIGYSPESDIPETTPT